MTGNGKDKNRQGQKAVIYARVSGAKQMREGDGLASQETRCREYASYKGHEIINVFRDDISGGKAARPAMAAMLSYLKAQRGQDIVVIIDDISRLARGLEAHLELRASLAKAGGKLESPSIEFGEDSDSILVENLLASVAQHQREKNGEQTFNRMRARMMNGYWCFQAPVGYIYKRVAGHGKLLVRNEPAASLITEALEGYASGHFESQAEVKRFLESHDGLFKKNKYNEIPQQRVTDILTRPIYAGYISHKSWNLDLVPGKHKGLISLETYQKIQARRDGVVKAPARKDISADFPLRGFVTCSDCGTPLTACWSKGKNRKYPYYLCVTKGCASKGKSIPRQKIEDAFGEIVRSLQPTPSLYQLAKAMFKQAWGQRQAQAGDTALRLKRDIAKLETQTEQLLDRIVDANNESVITAYEARIAKLELEKAIKHEKLENSTVTPHSFETMFEHASKFLASPCKLWDSGHVHLKKLVLRLAFVERIPYDRNTGFRTPKLSLPFKMLGDFDMTENKMVRVGGLEPPRGYPQRILSPACLPIPAHPQPEYAFCHNAKDLSLAKLKNNPCDIYSGFISCCNTIYKVIDSGFQNISSILESEFLNKLSI